MKRLITQPEQQIIGVFKGWDRVGSGAISGHVADIVVCEGVVCLDAGAEGVAPGVRRVFQRSDGSFEAVRGGGGECGGSEDRTGSGVGAELCGAVSVVRHSASPGEAAHRSGVAAVEVSAWVLVLHPSGVGLCHIRIQSWLPFTVPVCVNGREWLCRELAEAGIGFRRRDHCLIQVDDQAVAQKLLDAQPWHDGSAGLNA